MMKRKEVYTNITPLPSFVPRQLAIDILHSHSEIITLNPLVLDHRPISAPRNAPAEEYYSTWYEISERIQVIPGAGRLGSNKIHFRGCFHDVPWGVQTHIYAPMGIDLRHNYRVGGAQPGEPQEFRELGVNAPSTGLYLREDIEIRCNFAMVSFVKSQLKSASKVLVDRLIKKAELLDAGVLHAMMENGKLRTINPADRSRMQQQQQQDQYAPMSPALSSPASPPLRYQGTSRPSTSSSSGHPNHPDDYQQQKYLYPNQNSDMSQGQRSPAASTGKVFHSELPGDTYHYHQQPMSPNPSLLSPTGQTFRDSMQSTSSHPSTGGWSYASSMSSSTSNNAPTTNTNNNNNNNSNMNQGRPASTTSTIAPFVLVDNNYNNNNYGGGKQQFAAELPAMQEMHEENK